MPASLGNIFRYYVVSNYGAVGDGTTNDTTAVQAAMAAAATNGGIVFFPPGTYSCNTLTLPVGGKVSLLGSGFNASTIKSRAAESLLIFSGTTDPVASSCQVEGLCFDGNSTGTRGFDWTRLAYFSVNRCKIYRFSSIGVYLIGSLVGTFKDSWIDTCVTGVKAIARTTGDGGTYVQPNLVRFDHCQINRHTAWGVDWASAAGVQFRGCNFELDGTNGTSDSGGVKFTTMVSGGGEGVAALFDGCWWEEDNGGACLRINAPSSLSFTSLTNCMMNFNGTVTYGIDVDGGGSYDNHIQTQNLLIADVGTGVRLNGARAYWHRGAPDSVSSVTNTSGTITTYG